MFDLPSKKEYNSAYKRSMGGLDVPYRIPEEIVDEPAMQDALDALRMRNVKDLKPSQLYKVLEALYEMALDGDREAGAVAASVLETLEM